MNTRSGLLLMAILASYSLLCAQTGTLADYQYLSNAEITPEGSTVFFGADDELEGAVHTNSVLNTSDSFCCPNFRGLVTSCNAALGNWFGPFDNAFHGGLVLSAPEVSLDLNSSLDQIRAVIQDAHRYEGFAVVEGDTAAVTTYLKFLNTEYAVAQYLTHEVQAQLDENDHPTGIYDTLYVTPGDSDWILRPLPATQDEEVIVVDGVCRLEGFVESRITILASDSMFIMDDLLTADVILDDYPDAEVFGRVPEGSSNCIGLISEGNIIVANTLPNGAYNGASTLDICASVMGPLWAGGPAMPANTNIQGSRRKDVMITASMIALGCTFETEFWHTSATVAPFPETEGTGQGAPDVCGGILNSHIAYWPCYGDESSHDSRGTIWLDGSLVQIVRGYFSRIPVGPWGNAHIGYGNRYLRYDQNLYHRAPPMWPAAEGQTEYGLLLPEGIPSMAHLTPSELESIVFSDSAGVFLRGTPDDVYIPDSYQVYINHQLFDDELQYPFGSYEITLEDSTAAVFQPFWLFDIYQFCEPGDTVHYEIGTGAWNRGGDACSWVLRAAAMQAEAVTLGVACGTQAVYSEFVEEWNSAQNHFRITDGGYEHRYVRLIGYENEVLAESETDEDFFTLPALPVSQYTDSQSYCIHLELYATWSDTTWSSADSYTWWHNDAPEMEWLSEPPACGQYSSAGAFVNAWNESAAMLSLSDSNSDNVSFRLMANDTILREWVRETSPEPYFMSLGSLNLEDLPEQSAEIHLEIQDRLGFPPEGYEPCSWWYNSDTDVSPPELPQALSLRAFPNPFNPSTTVELALPRSGEVKLTLYNLQGRQLRVIREAAMAAGLYHIPIHGQSLASGLYLLRAEAPGATGQRQQQVHKLLLVR